MKKRGILSIITFMAVFLTMAFPVMADADWGGETRYFYNWDNTDNATKWGLWGGNGNLQGDVCESVDDIRARHAMQLSCDGDNVYLKIRYASCFDNPGNGWDYNFYVNDVGAKFTVTFDDGQGLDSARKDPGSYGLTIKHGDGAISGSDVEGAYGDIIVNENQLNNEQTICIPLSELKRQNESIDLDNMTSIDFFTPNLMTERLNAGAHYNKPAGEESASGEGQGEGQNEGQPEGQSEEQPGEEQPAGEPVGDPGEGSSEGEPLQEESYDDGDELSDKVWYAVCIVMGDKEKEVDAFNPNETHQKKFCGTAENTVIYLNKRGEPVDMKHIKRGSNGQDKTCYLFTDETFTEPRELSTIRPGDHIYWETRNGSTVWHHNGWVTDPDNPMEVIERFVVDDSVEEGTVLREYVENIDGRDVLVREIAIKSNEENDDKEFDPTDHFGLVDNETDPPSIDNGKWNDVPAQWEYNWDNTEQATKWGIWGGNGHLENYITDHMDDINVRHHMAMYCDGRDIHLYIEYASCFDGAGNGNDYNFYIDGIGAKFRVTYDDGTDLTAKNMEPGEYILNITHGDGSVSGQEVYGAYGKIIVKEGQLNNMQEIVIPLSELKKQNDNINLDAFSKVEFFTPNLMYRHISCAGASTGYGFVLLLLLLGFGVLYDLTNGFKGFGKETKN